MPGVAPPSSILRTPPAAKLTLPVCRMPALAPGESVPPASTLTARVVPLPPSVPLFLTAMAEAIEPSTRSRPAWTIVAPGIAVAAAQDQRPGAGLGETAGPGDGVGSADGTTLAG